MSVQTMFDKANESRLASMSKGRQVTVKCSVMALRNRILQPARGQLPTLVEQPKVPPTSSLARRRV